MGTSEDIFLMSVGWEAEEGQQHTPRLVGGVEHVQEVFGVGQALVGLADVAAAGPVVRQRRDGRHLACAAQ